MFTLDRVSLTTIGLGIGLVLSGCMSPTGETAESADDDEAAVETTAAAIHEDEQAMAGDKLPDQLQTNVTSEEPMTGEGENVDSTKSAIFIGGGFGRGFGWGGGLGWGGLGGWGFGARRIGWGGWGGGLGFPGVWGGGLGWGVPVGYGYNTGFVGGCGLYGCGRAFW